MSQAYTGGCQCGAIRFRAAALIDNGHICHCRMCQKAAGHLFGARVGVWLRDLTWTQGQPARFHSSAGMARGFCANCGTSLFFHNEEVERLSMSVGSFDDPQGIPLRYELGMEGRLPQIDQLASLECDGTTEEDDPEGAAVARRTNRQHPDHDTEDWTPATG